MENTTCEALVFEGVVDQNGHSWFEWFSVLFLVPSMIYFYDGKGNLIRGNKIVSTCSKLSSILRLHLNLHQLYILQMMPWNYFKTLNIKEWYKSVCAYLYIYIYKNDKKHNIPFLSTKFTLMNRRQGRFIRIGTTLTN